MRDKKLYIWGCGYLGFSNLVYYGKKGYKCIGIDIIENLQEMILKGNYKSDLLLWIHEPYLELFKSGVIQVTSDWEKLDVQENDIHIICVPTEDKGEPYLDALYNVIDKIVALNKDLSKLNLLIESTMPAGTAAQILSNLKLRLNYSINFCVSPRRDWFTEGGRNIFTVSRVYGCNSKEAEMIFAELLSSLCPHIVKASDYRYAEFSKSVENSIRQLGIIYADQLADAFPYLDVREVLQLAGTKWNINTYIPSFGPGGYCIPLSGKYVIDACKNGEIPLIKECVSYTSNRPYIIAEQIIEKIQDGAKVLILGTAYMGNVAVDKESPIVKIIEVMNSRGIVVYVHDPYFGADAVKRYHCNSFDLFNADVSEFARFDAVILNSAHDCYTVELGEKIVLGCRLGIELFDNTGKWKELEDRFNSKGNYRLIGTPSWFGRKRN